MKTKAKQSILFVCSANQCRSPMAEALFIQLLEKNRSSSKEWIISSAGCWAYPGMPATAKANQTMEDKGTHFHLHSSKAVTEKLLNAFNLILCMEKAHKQFIKKNFPQTSNKVFLFSEMIGEIFDVDDPVGGTQQDYLQTADLLQEILQKGFKKISKLSKS